MYWKYIFAFIPALSGYVTSALCPMPDSSNIPFRPPPWVFMVVWPILYALFGYSWFLVVRDKGILSPGSIAHGLLNFWLVMWLVFYSCLKWNLAPVYVLVVSILTGIYASILSGKTSSLLLVPLLVWLSFATLMNLYGSIIRPKEKK